MLAIACPTCGKTLKLRDEYVGKRIKCPGCGKPVDTSSEATQPPSAQAEQTQAGPVGRESAVDFLAPPQASGEIGRLGGYRVVKVLGKGGMGMVFEAIDSSLDRTVALKVMLPSVAANPSAKARFLREAKAAAALKHDNIITIYQVGEDRNIPYLAMEFLEGMPLDAAMKSGRKLGLSQILRIGREIARGLAAAHEKNLIHRDIKPANVWLEKTANRVKILDFGLARSQQEDVQITQSGAIIGTPAYMAPEQARGDKTLDHRVDLFSLGCLLHRLVAGELPFQGESTMAILMALAMNDPKPLTEFDPNLPPEFSDLVRRLLAKNAADRPASAKEVAAMIQQIEKQLTLPRSGDRSEKKADSTFADMMATPNAAAEETEFTVVADNRGKTVAPGARAGKRPAATTPQKPASGRGPRRPKAIWWIGGGVGLLLALALVALGGLLLRVETDSGTLLVRVDDPDVEVAVRQGSLVLKNQQEYVLKPGNGQIEVTTRDGVSLLTKQFTMKKGGRETVNVSLEVKNARNKAPAITPPVTPPIPSPATPGEIVLYDGKDVSAWTNPDWQTPNGYMEARGGNTSTRESFGDFKLHIEFWIPLMANQTGQMRGNSGIFLQNRFELQILDSYGNTKPLNNECGSIYGMHAPLKGACAAPETWQTYDITYFAPKKDGTPAEVTVMLNGEKIHDRAKLPKLGPGATAPYGDDPHPITLQFHNDPVRFRNIRITPLKEGARADAEMTFFNGVDLGGFDGMMDHWSVQKGDIVGKSPGINFNTFLCSKKTYGDFDLTFQVKLPTGNSGVQIRSRVNDSNKFTVGGPQVDMGPNYWGCLYGEQFGGMMKEADQAKVAKVLRPSEFNDFFISAVGKHIIIKINGVTTVDDDFPTAPDTGIIAFQLHSGPPYSVVYRDIKLRTIR